MDATFLYLRCLLFLFCFLSHTKAGAVDERQLLLKFKSTFENSSTNSILNIWNSSNPVCSFSGVACNGKKFVREIDLTDQNLSGFLVLDDICQLKSLEKLVLRNNAFHPRLFPSEIFSLKNLTYLDLANCSLQGPVPKSIGNLSELTLLDLSYNNMVGEIPSEVGKLTKLWQLELYCNHLNGTLPFGLRNLTNLENFDASKNLLEGNLLEFRFSKNIVSLHLYENNLSGEVPAEFGEFKKLVDLGLFKNMLTGPLPQKLGSWSKFDSVDLSENFLTGTIPPDMCKMGTMTKLLFVQNKLSGEIPQNYAKCTTLKRFRVNNNLLYGVVPPGIWGLPNAEIIDIRSNRFEGPITSHIGKARTLPLLFVSYNQLSGELPDEISKATFLVSIVLDNNRFSGRIPRSLGDLKHLSILYLQSNMFSASIPKSLGRCFLLSDVNMAHNLLSGEIPSSLGSLPSLNSLNLSHNQLSGQIPEKLASLMLLDLTHNRLTGVIPKTLSIAAYKSSISGNPGLCSMYMSSFPQCSPGSGLSKDVRIVIICFSVGSAILLVLLICALFLKKRKDEERTLKEESWELNSFHVLSFTQDEILDSIRQENLIGRGASGNVYRVLLADGKELAVKHIWNTDPSGGKSKAFDAEVATLSSIRHINVVKLYCSITSEGSSFLVYEYLPNGNLWDRLHTSEDMKLAWEPRYEIAVGAAKGLEYLHHCLERPMMHRDVKSSNILLDELLKPRIADFGLAKIVEASAGRDSTHVVAGTHGYIAPEYGYTYRVNEKSDVYSFGVVLMELVTGKKPMEPEFGETNNIVSWACTMHSSRESIPSMVDSYLPKACKEEAIKVLRIAMQCTDRLPERRPSMRSVVRMLEEVHELGLQD
ncbi:unnamed protein product [Prunus armeniaca]|uniref:non-specific serine/threonine protein kinase n=1 Tax=Prunus armeniaca TaxID=36596 RepID=A0A6J5YA77_PRUAR|nr:unnamed protein product [Prunus armeniaca]